MGLTITLLWLVRTSKVFLFYFYLWQLKEYQVKRFIDHFRTAKGKLLIFNKLNILKLILLVCFLFFGNNILASALLILILFFLYFAESVKTVADFFQKKIKIPVITVKTLLLIFAGFAAEIIILCEIIKGQTVSVVINACVFSAALSKFDFAFWLLLFDIISPLIASLIVLSLQPIAVLFRNRIIKKAIKKREQFKNLVVIGITGSYGKTTTKEILATILSAKFNVLKTKEHQNSEIGIAQCILNDLTDKHRVFVVEMGSYGKGGIRLLSKIVQPKIGVVTGINEQHLALFGSMDNLISAEGGIELAESIPKDGIMVLNGNNEILLEKIKTESEKLHIKTIIISTREKRDLWAENIAVEKEMINFKVFSKEGESADFFVNVAGAHNIENILLAAAVAKELNMSLEEISRACKEIRLEQGEIKLLRGKNGINIIDSSYSANPNGVLADLDYLSLYSGRKVIVMPCLIELGSASKEIHKRIGEKIAKVCDLAIITTKDFFEEIKNRAVSIGMKQENILFIEDPKKIILILNNYLKIDDAVLFEGRINKSVIEQLTINN